MQCWTWHYDSISILLKFDAFDQFFFNFSKYIIQSGSQHDHSLCHMYDCSLFSLCVMCVCVCMSVAMIVRVFQAWVVMYFNGTSSVVLDQIRLILMYRVTANIEDEEEDKLFLASCLFARFTCNKKVICIKLNWIQNPKQIRLQFRYYKWYQCYCYRIWKQ